MPVMTVRKAAEVPQPSNTSKAVREQQKLFESFIRRIGSDEAGELDPAPGEQIRALKVRLRRASTRLNTQIEIWDANDKVYFIVRQLKRGRGRPRKVA